MVLVIASVTAAVAFGVTMLRSGMDSAGADRSGVVKVDVSGLHVGAVATATRPIDALGGAMWPVLVVAESRSEYSAFLGRSPHLGCRVSWVDDPHYTRFSTGRAVAFEDPCGGAEFTLAGVCIGGPCSRGLDHFPIAVSNGEARIDLNALADGPPRGAP